MEATCAYELDEDDDAGILLNSSIYSKNIAFVEKNAMLNDSSPAFSAGRGPAAFRVSKTARRACMRKPGVGLRRLVRRGLLLNICSDRRAAGDESALQSAPAQDAPRCGRLLRLCSQPRQAREGKTGLASAALQHVHRMPEAFRHGSAPLSLG